VEGGHSPGGEFTPGRPGKGKKRGGTLVRKSVGKVSASVRRGRGTVYLPAVRPKRFARQTRRKGRIRVSCLQKKDLPNEV